ncbi:S-adenosyl-L-methionine-dependent methyltransferase [Aspergillus crustosus]
MPSAIQAPEHLKSLLETLHTKSLTQEATLPHPLPPRCTPAFNAIMADKFIALEQDKAEFVYNLVRAIRATNVVEAGTSFGVSTVYLALAVAQNAGGLREGGGDVQGGARGRVIATENEEAKAAQARENWALAGRDIEGVIELRVGDLLETLKEDLGVVDLLLLDIWTPLALPTLKLVQPSLRSGAVIVADNTVASYTDYTPFREYVEDPQNGFRRLLLPYKGGLDMIIYEPQVWCSGM